MVNAINNHLCSEICFAARMVDKLTISCFVCGKKFNSKCFGLSSPQVMKALSTVSNAIFMCHVCIDRVTKWKQSQANRRSVNAMQDTGSTTIVELQSEVQSVHQDHSILSSLLSAVSALDDKFSHLQDCSEQIKAMVSKGEQNGASALGSQCFTDELSRLSNVVTDLSDKFDHSQKHSTVLKQNFSMVMDKLSSANPPMTPRNAAQVIAKNVVPMTDPLGWSFTSHPSGVPAGNSDVYQLLHGFERNTWVSFDYIRQKLCENSVALKLITEICNESNVKNGNNQLCSPVLDSITVDSLQMLNEKSENIKKTLSELDRKLQSLQDAHTDNDELTQQLRIRFLSQMDDIKVDIDVVQQSLPVVTEKQFRTQQNRQLQSTSSSRLHGVDQLAANDDNSSHLNPTNGLLNTRNPPINKLTTVNER